MLGIGIYHNNPTSFLTSLKVCSANSLAHCSPSNRMESTGTEIFNQSITPKVLKTCSCQITQQELFLGFELSGL